MITERQHWMRLIGNADIEPRDFPPAAVLFVRRLPDPMPRRALTHPDAPALSPEWEAAVRSALSDAYWRNVDSDHWSQPPAGFTVAFADAAEMLAALSADLAAGEARRRWWWRAAIRDLPADPGDAIHSLWTARPELVPAIVGLLTASGRHRAVTAILPARQAWTLVLAVARAFELTALAEVLDRFGSEPARLRHLFETSAAAHLATPWDSPADSVVRLDDTAAPAHRVLIGIALLLRRRGPQAISRPDFIRAIERWLLALAAPAAPSPDESFAAQLPHSTPTPSPAAEAPEDNISDDPAITLDVDQGPAPRVIETEFGGIFFLINLATSLDLFRFADELSPWAILELIARCLLTRRERRYLSDPVWRLLAELEGRAPDRPISPGFRGVAEYRLPDSWIAPPPRLQARSRYRLYLGDPLGCDCSPDLRRFLAFLMPYLRWRLHTWLGPKLAVALLLRRSRVYVTPTHIDLVLPLDAATVPVRAAGLDANPGWRPHLGRIIHFHYRS